MDLVNEVGHRSVLAPLQIDVAVRSSVMSISDNEGLADRVTGEGRLSGVGLRVHRVHVLLPPLTPCGLISSG